MKTFTKDFIRKEMLSVREVMSEKKQCLES